MSLTLAYPETLNREKAENATQAVLWLLRDKHE